MIRPLVGMPVSRVWNGGASALFLELGDLQPWDTGRRRRSKRGEVTLQIEWNWRVQTRTKILVGSDQSNWAINKYIRRLKGLEIVAIALDDEVKNDLIVQFSEEIQLQTSRLTSGDGEWLIWLKDGTLLEYERHGLVRGDGHDVVDDPSEEPKAIRLANAATDRWGKPVVEPRDGTCQDCEYYVQLDGPLALLNYGVCVAEGGPFDGRVVQYASGCPLFAALPD